MADLALATTTASTVLSSLLSTTPTPTPASSDAAGDPFAMLIATLVTAAPTDSVAPVAVPAPPAPAMPIVVAMPAPLQTPTARIVPPTGKGETEGQSAEANGDEREDGDDTSGAPIATPDMPPIMAALVAVAPPPIETPKALPEAPKAAPKLTLIQPKTAEAPVQQAETMPTEAPQTAAQQAAWMAVAQLTAEQPQTPVAAALPVASADEAPGAPVLVAANDIEPTDSSRAPAAQPRRDVPNEPVVRTHQRSADEGKRDGVLPRLKAVKAGAPVLPHAFDIALRNDAPATAAQPPASLADTAIARTLSVAQDGQWLDALAKDIAATASGQTLQFRLDPAHLGALTVQIEHGSDGATVRLHSDNADTRQMLTDAQPRLAAEARAQGLTLKETSVGSQTSEQRPQSHGNFARSDTGQGGQTPRQPIPTTATAQEAPPAPVTVSDDTARYA